MTYYKARITNRVFKNVVISSLHDCLEFATRRTYWLEVRLGRLIDRFTDTEKKKKIVLKIFSRHRQSNRIMQKFRTVNGAR